MQIVMECFDNLHPDLRLWINNLHFSLHDDHILRGNTEVMRCKQFLESGGKEHYNPGNGQN